MDIRHKLVVKHNGEFEELLEIWACFHCFITEKYDWQELPQQFTLKECTSSEYEYSPAVTIHIQIYNYDISFQKGTMKVSINMREEEYDTTTYSISFSDVENTSHDFSISTLFQEFRYNTENPFYHELINTVSSIPGFVELTSF